jgi:hypothetical protein
MPRAGPEPDLTRYREDLLAMLPLRSPGAYRAFVRRWRDLLQRGAAERLLAMDDAALRRRLEHMILDAPPLADLHESARAYLAEHAAPPPATAAARRPGPRPGP